MLQHDTVQGGRHATLAVLPALYLHALLLCCQPGEPVERQLPYQQSIQHPMFASALSVSLLDGPCACWFMHSAV
jgi:hypothetical protein